jgi:hypothetical protein
MYRRASMPSARIIVYRHASSRVDAVGADRSNAMVPPGGAAHRRTACCLPCIVRLPLKRR